MSSSSGYQLVQSLGSGVSGSVYLAEVAGRKVAIRQFVSTSEASSQAWSFERQRFLEAGRQARVLTHPRIVPVLEVIDEGSEAFVAMEYMDTETLRIAMAARSFAPGEAYALLRQIAMALDFAHQCGVVHGDLKPGDIFLDRQGAKVSDFAISPRANLAAGRSIPPALLHGYLSPEHVRNPQSVSARSDQFALAIIAYELYTGLSPYSAGVLDLPSAISNSQIVPPSQANRQVPPELDAPLMRALSPDPLHRFSSCLEFVAMLGAVMITQPEGGVVPRSRSGLFVAAALLVLAGAGAYYLWPGKKPPTAPSAQSLPGPAPSARVSDAASGQAAEKPGTKASPDSQLQRDLPEVQASSKPKPFALPPSPIPGKAPIRRQAPSNLTGSATSKAAIAYAPAKPGACFPVSAVESGFEIQVFAETHALHDGDTFQIGDPTLGRMAYGDLQAGVMTSGRVAAHDDLVLEWVVDDRVMSKSHVPAKGALVVYRNKPTEGAYGITLKRNGCAVSYFHFRITPSQL